ncbi:TPA: phosphoribosylformylglycinamidine synthase subunit PurL [Campylobacter fetus subsp. venerealis]|uniref:Phosphoribosylformylglycinamidine synthase subunit PurL n=1 Tax=Campylobacter fetus subsp. venerealis NCTC 10354 TaxID=983328 RepID=A0AAE6IY96_CAMFE|nr:phosphoribosylformylglycinamidine synthase subunit PurL [Campylobacter fetus]OCS22277.1 phosphoribosylformylglycinamidine synthase [Campylobacter fetus subsp. venerealis cfvi97/532]OCS26078.1 phosphoribosylformylglycinamidine synthase [Campylobacter fetus subsp. venerealis cfvB10]OCS29411.1 phosphoribosylformylglycinamidine synthase [Campylobacter fetus subsp. venerealis LMG 6570 = CCUG 33900]OCS42405.1 phosphoribosylformylglycinamidine synthase [Campylobacter fetus subsp. venerealis cfvi02/
MDKKIVKAHKISDSEYAKILEILGREPNLLELGIFSAMWSEHCSYKSSKKYLNGFPTKAPWVIQGPGENAGVIDCGDGVAAVFKMESHNHPSFIEPFQGAATGVGGIFRDIFTMGARVEASLNSLRFGEIRGEDPLNRHQRYLVKGVVGGIGHYGNCMGVPTVGGETTFDPSFNGNILVNAFALGICKKNEIFYAKAEGVGNPVIYVGSKTGRDGLGGAVMASDSFNEENKSLRPTVQVGDPFAEKLLMEACLELFKQDYIVGIQDMGAAGLTSSSFEMAGHSSSGMKMYLDKVPMREDGMTPYDLMLSESQERMLICAKKGCEDKIKEIFAKWDLSAEIIGEVTDTGIMELFWHDELVGSIPIDPLSEAAPVLDRAVKRPAYLGEIKDLNLENYPKFKNQDAFLKLLKDPNISNKSLIYDQYDANIGTNTIKKPGNLGAAIIRIKENGRAISMGMECNTRHNYVNPKIGAAAAVAASGRKVAMSGATPLAITDCLNYGNPQNPEVMWQFANGCEGIKEACAALQTPVVSGNVSLYNETDGVSVQPTPAIVTVGVNENADKSLNSIFKNSGTAVYLLGDTSGEFGGSLYVNALYGVCKGELKEIDYKKERALWDLVIEANKIGILEFANSVGVGGVAMTLAKMSAVSNLGFDGECKFDDSKWIFDESFSRAVVGVKDESKFKELADKHSVKFEKIGLSTGEIFRLNDIKINLNELKNIYFNEFSKITKSED